MKRALQIIVGCIVAASVAATTTANEAVYRYRGADRDSRLLENARREGTVVLYMSLAPTESGPLGQVFEKKTGIKVDIFRTISENTMVDPVTVLDEQDKWNKLWEGLFIRK